MPRSVAIVTDSTAYLPPDLAAKHAVRVVPLRVVINGVAGAEGIEITPDDVVLALAGRRTTVTTSRPAPAEFAAVYRQAFAEGADAVISIHLSGRLSGTVESARVAVGEAAGPVEVVDSGVIGMGLGFAVLAAAETADTGAELAAVRAAAEAAVRRTTILFYVDTLEHLRRGGRIGAAVAFLGTALAVKPLLHVVDGTIVLREKVRTASRGLARLEELAIEAAGRDGCDLAIHHLAMESRAVTLRDRLLARLPELGRVVVSEVGAAVGAHVGPGLVGLVVVRDG